MLKNFLFESRKHNQVIVESEELFIDNSLCTDSIKPTPNVQCPWLKQSDNQPSIKVHEETISLDQNQILKTKDMRVEPSNEDILFKHVFAKKDTCEQTINITPEKSSLKVPQGISAQDKDVTAINEVMLINKYENENALNGGMLYGNLQAWDDMATSYSEYDEKM
jgi:hypothetical protein